MWPVKNSKLEINEIIITEQDILVFISKVKTVQALINTLSDWT